MTGWIVAFALAQALDTGSSCAAFARGAREGNPLLPSTCAPLVAVKAGMTAGYAVGMRPLFASHPRLAKALTLGITVGVAAVGVRNLRTGAPAH